MTEPDDERAASGSGRTPGGSDWDWFLEEDQIRFRMMFVRGAAAERVIEAFGADPADTRMPSAEITHDTITRAALGHEWVRAGRSGEWAFAVGEWHENGFEQVALELSAGAEVALLSDFFRYLRDGTQVTWFVPEFSAWRYGSDPDWFVPQMRQAGLAVDPPADLAEFEFPPRDPRIGVLEMLTLALGVRLSREAAMGPLLTVRPGPAVSGPNASALSVQKIAITEPAGVPAASEPVEGEADWEWFVREYPNGGVRLTFVRGATPEQVIEAFRADPAAAQLLTAEGAEDMVGYPWVRVGRAGEWAFAIDTWHELSTFGEFGKISNEFLELSAGTELALLESTVSSSLFWYLVQGVEVTSFEPLMSPWRGGSDPDRFVSQMRETGLDVDPPADDAELGRDPQVALLEMLTLALGIRLHRGVAMGPLLTVEPGSAAPGRSGPGASAGTAAATGPDDGSAASGPSQVPGGSEWDWIDEDCPNAIRLMFVRGVTPERVIEAFGAEPADAQLLTADVAHETAALQGRPSVRVGRAGEWAFAIDDWHEARDFQRIALELSGGTDLALFDEGLTSDSPDFSYLVDGAEMTGFEPLVAHERSGSDPDRFVPQMRQAGLIAAPHPEDAGLQDSPRVALLDMLTLALGIRLSRGVAMGPLLTVEPGSRA